MTEHEIKYTYTPARKEIIAQNEIGDVVGEIEYTGTDEFWSIIHTGVRPAYRGGTIAKNLVRQVVEAAREQGVQLGATCSYAIKVLRETPEYHDVYSPPE